MKKYSWITILFLLVTLTAKGQDFHLSHYDAAMQYLNPALTGMYFGQEGDYRLNSNYRSQWRSISGRPFATMMLGYDQPFKEKFGVGGYLINNRAGLGKFNTLNFLLSGAYNVINDPSNVHNLTVGLQMGFLYKSFDPGQFLFDNQYSSSSGEFEQGLPSGEVFARTSILKFDANMGIFYRYQEDGKRVKPFGGISLYHLTRPNESFTAEKERLPVRFTLHGGSDIQVNDQVMIRPTLLFMYQARAKEINIGAMGFYHLDNTDFDIMLGTNYRNKDAIVIQTGLKHKNNFYRISYDINTSYLSGFSNGRGGLELSVVYTGDFEETKKLFSPKID